LCWLLRTTNEFTREKLGQCGFKLRLRVSFPVRRHEEPRIVLFTLESAEEAGPIVQEQVPFTLIGQMARLGFIDKLLEVRVSRLKLLGTHPPKAQDEEQDRNE
jgi:hypothetical protein